VLFEVIIFAAGVKNTKLC